MAQARTLRKSELKQLIDVTASCSRYPQRDVTMLLFSHLCGLRVGEIASLRFDDVLDDKSNVLDEVTLDASRTKGKRARKIFLPRQMQKHLQEYVASIRERPLHGFLFSTQKRLRALAPTQLHSTYSVCTSVLAYMAPHLIADAELG